MKIFVTLQLTFEHLAPEGRNPFAVELPAGSTVSQALEALSIPASAPKVIIVNGRAAVPGKELSDGDRLTLFSPVAGG
ncbi:MAG: MoaD/ThiS family protein [Pseudomonadota bacterium]